MRPSKRVFEVNALLEGRRYKAYRAPEGHWTIGEGHTLGVHEGDTATDAQIDKWVRQDFMKADAALKTLYPGPLLQKQVDALTLFINNVGVNAFATSTLLKRLTEKRFDEVPKELRRWVFVGTTPMPGLKVRRAVEELIWRHGAAAIDGAMLNMLRELF